MKNYNSKYKIKRDYIWKVSVSFMLMFLVSAAFLPAEDDGSMTSAELAAIISEKLDVFPDIMNTIPGLSAKEIAKSKFEYYFEVEEDLTKDYVKIVNLDREKLYSLYVKVTNEFTRLNTERTLKQLEDMDNLNNILRIQKQSENMQSMEAEQSRLRSRLRTGEEPSSPNVRINWAPPSVPRTPGTPEER